MSVLGPWPSVLVAALALLAGWPSADATTVRIYDASPTPVQLVHDAASGASTLNVHLYVLVDAGDATRVAQGGAFWRWPGSQEWRPAPAPLYDEHQVDPVKAGTTTRGYNIAFSMNTADAGPVGEAMEFRVWALAPGEAPALAEASKPVERLPPAALATAATQTARVAGDTGAAGAAGAAVPSLRAAAAAAAVAGASPLSELAPLPPSPLAGLLALALPSAPAPPLPRPRALAVEQALSVSLFKAVSFRSASTRGDGVHAHLVINVYPPQPATPPDYQLFADIAVAGVDGENLWEEVGAPSRFEHTWDVVDGKVHSRYNLSWRLSGKAALAAEADDPEPLRIRVRAASLDGASGELELEPLPIVSV